MTRASVVNKDLNASIRNWEVLILFLAAAVTGVVFANHLPAALYLDLHLILVLYVGWYSPPAKGAFCGFSFGLLQDAVSGLFLGINGLSKTLLGYYAGYLSRLIRVDNFFGRLLLICALSLLDSGVVYCMLSMLGQAVRDVFWIDALVKSVVTGMAGAFGSRFYDRFKFPEKDFRRLEPAG
jgi:rod shape-determining protein MreD